jgi:hypothetical protein
MLIFGKQLMDREDDVVDFFVTIFTSGIVILSISQLFVTSYLVFAPSVNQEILFFYVFPLGLILCALGIIIERDLLPGVDYISFGLDFSNAGSYLVVLGPLSCLVYSVVSLLIHAYCFVTTVLFT